MPLLTTVGMILGGASAIKGFMGGGQMVNAGQRTLNKMRDVELKNAYENVKPSLMGEQLMFGQTNRRMSQVADVAQGMDAASAMGLINATQGNLNEVELQGISSILDKEYQADVLRGNDDVRIQQQLEGRNQARRAEAVSQISAGQQMQTSALEGAASLAISAGNAQEMAAAQGGFDSVKSMNQFNKATRMGRRYDRLGGTVDTKGLNPTQIRGLINTQATAGTGGTGIGQALRFINPFGGNFLNSSLFN